MRVRSKATPVLDSWWQYVIEDVIMSLLDWSKNLSSASSKNV